jgi:hypothetical protein
MQHTATPKQNITQENWFARAKAIASEGVPTEDRVFGVFIVIFSMLMLVIFNAHETKNTGFFTQEFGALEKALLYGYWLFWITTASLESIFGMRLASRIFDVFIGGIPAILASFVLVVIFPFDFTHYADVFPEGLRFLVGWMSDDIMRGLWLLLSIGLAGGLAYAPFAYKFIVRRGV